MVSAEIESFQFPHLPGELAEITGRVRMPTIPAVPIGTAVVDTATAAVAPERELAVTREPGGTMDDCS
jgi:hypothetical protein